MNQLVNRDYHETIQKIIPVNVNSDFRTGDYYLSKIPYNQVEEMKNTKKDLNKVSLDEMKILLPKLNFNLPDSNFKLMEKYYVDNGDYWGLYDFLINKYPFNLMSKYALYKYCRNLVNKPMTPNEITKIKLDIKAIDKSMKAIKQKIMKKNKQRVEVKF